MIEKSLKILNRNCQGQSLIEFIVALGIIIIVTGGGATIILGTLIANKRLEDHVAAQGFVNEGIAAVKSIRNQDWENLENGTYGLENSGDTWSLTTSPNLIQGKYSREILIEDASIEGEVNTDIKRITTSVSWEQSPSKIGEATNSIYLSNWHRASADIPGGMGEGTCEDFCKSMGYSGGRCRPHPDVCVSNNEDHIPYGSQFCTTGARITCCCSN